MTAVQTDLTMRGLLVPGRRRDYVLAGNAIVTIRSISTGTRFTYKVQMPAGAVGTGVKPRTPFFVKVLTGPENASDYQYIGTIFADRVTGAPKFHITTKSHFSPDAPSVRAFAWFVGHMEDPRTEVWHEGVCGRCGRRLTVPESIASGIGPTCAGK